MNNEQTPIRPTLRNLPVGETVTFPIIRMQSVKSTAAQLAIVTDAVYKTCTDKVAKTISVTRTL